MRYLAACLCQIALLVCMAPLPSIGSEEQMGGMEEGVAKIVDRRNSPEITSRPRPSSRLFILPRQPSIADRATLVEARRPLPGHVLPNGLLAPLRC